MNSFTTFEFNFERTEYSDDGYSIIGRALTVATKFEKELLYMATLLNLKSNPQILSDKQAFKNFINELEKFQSLFNSIKKLNPSKNIMQLLENAKNSRNFIAHELTLGMEYSLDNDKKKKSLVEDLSIHVLNIVEAEKILLTIFCELNKEQKPTKFYFDSYSKRVVSWVIESYI